jgi:hypothetical protein
VNDRVKRERASVIRSSTDNDTSNHLASSARNTAKRLSPSQTASDGFGGDGILSSNGGGPNVSDRSLIPLTSHTLTKLSLPVVTNRRLSGENAKPRTPPPWEFHTATSSQVNVSKTQTPSSQSALYSSEPSGESSTVPHRILHLE